MRYYVKCKLNLNGREKLADSLKYATLGKGEIFYEGMMAAVKEGTIDDDNVVHFVEVCYCLEGGLYPMAMELPTLKEYFESVGEVKDARLREECTMECEACDCTRAIKLPGKSLVDELNIREKMSPETGGNVSFSDMGRVHLNRKKQKQGLGALKKIVMENNHNIMPVMAGAAISGLFVILKDDEFFRIKDIPDTDEARQIISGLGLGLSDSVESVKSQARHSLAQSDKRSNIV
jgi:hypothetical protein